MEINEDPNAPVTRFTSLNVVPEQSNVLAGDFFGCPQLTQAEILEIPVENLLPGIMVYNTTYNVYMSYFINTDDPTQNRWNNINTSLTYTGTGYEVGSPFALPAGPASVVEASANNMDPGVMYVNTENNDKPRIYIPSLGWQDIAIGGTTDTFVNITVTDTATINNLNVVTTTTGDLNVVGNALIQNLQVGTSADSGGICGYAVTPNDPTVVLGTAGHGTGGTPSIGYAGSELSGILTITTGTNLSGTVICTFTIHNPVWQVYSWDFAAIFYPADTTTFGDSFGAVVTTVVTQLATSSVPAIITMSSGGDTQLAESTTYRWNYIIIGNTTANI